MWIANDVNARRAPRPGDVNEMFDQQVAGAAPLHGRFDKERVKLFT